MHIYFSGIGGAGISALASLAYQAGYEVSGSDLQEDSYTTYLRAHNITDIAIDQSYAHIAAVHAAHPIDWLVYSSAVGLNEAEPAELQFCKYNNIRSSKRDAFLNTLLEQKGQKMVALAGTHGKSTTTAMVIWLCQQVSFPLSYAIGAKISFGDLSLFDARSEYFVYECDEFDRNFLAFKPFVSGITGLSWDHHEIFPTRENYNDAFRQFIDQSQQTIIWQNDLETLDIQTSDRITAINPQDKAIDNLKLYGHYNRQDGWLAMQIVAKITGRSIAELQPLMDRFPGLAQRMERLAPNLYTNYAHTPEKIRGGMSTALEMAEENQQNVVVLYEPLTNRRQHYIKDQYSDSFKGAVKIYWIPTYLAREDSKLPTLSPSDLIPYLDNAQIAQPAQLDDKLLKNIQEHLAKGDLVVAMGASGKGSMDEWLRQHFN